SPPISLGSWRGARFLIPIGCSMNALRLQPVLTISRWGHRLVVARNIPMLEHSNPVRQAPSRVVIIGARGILGGTISACLTADKVPMLPLTRQELDLLKSEAAAGTLQRLLRADDSVVFVSALAPTRNNAMLIDNLRMVEAVCAALAAQPVAHLV